MSVPGQCSGEAAEGQKVEAEGQEKKKKISHRHCISGAAVPRGPGVN